MRTIALALLLAVSAFAQYTPPSGGGGGPVSASDVSAGIFGAGNYVFPGNVAIGTALAFNGNETVTQVAEPATPATANLAGAGAGNVDNGLHDYVVKFCTSIGCTGPGPAVTVTVADKTVNGRVALTNIPTGPAGTVSRQIYRSYAYANVNFTGLNLLTTLANNVATTYTDNTADASLGAPMYTSNTTAGAIYDSGGDLVQGYTSRIYGDSGPVQEFVLSADGWASCFVDSAATGDQPHCVFGISQYAAGAGGGAYLYGNSTSGAPPLGLQAIYLDSAPLPPNFAYVTVIANRRNNEAALDGENIFAVDTEASLLGGTPTPLVVTSAYDGTSSGGFPNGGGRVGINQNVPVATLDLLSVYPDRVAWSIQSAAAQTANLFQTVADDGVTVENALTAGGDLLLKGLKTIGAAATKKVVCVDTTTGQLYASSSDTACAN